MAPELAAFLRPHPLALALAVLLDLAIGDPEYRWHPIRLIGRTLTAGERVLRRAGADGYGGGVALFMILSLGWIAVFASIVMVAAGVETWLGWTAHVLIVYSLLAFGDLLRHVWRVERPLMRNDLQSARIAVARLVGRDVDRMDAAACRRAAIESLSENLTDGFTSALFWYAALGLPGLVLFKVVSTMDSMVGYRTPQYVRFGWCGARADDVMNVAPARATWMLLSGVAATLPRCSARKAWRVGWTQHAILPGPNSGWSEAATAGAIQRRLVGPIWIHGALVTDAWLGDPADPPAQDHADVVRAMTVVAATAVVAGVITCALIAWMR